MDIGEGFSADSNDSLQKDCLIMAPGIRARWLQYYDISARRTSKEVFNAIREDLIGLQPQASRASAAMQSRFHRCRSD